MTPSLAAGLAIAAAYLVGSVSWATVLVRLFHGQDIREAGSGNAGATNVLRTAGFALGLATLVLDALKGTAGVFFARGMGANVEAACAVAAIVGHVFPAWFGFRGGKGVATAVGAFAVILPLPVAAATALFALVVAITRMVSVGSVAAALGLPLLAAFAFHAPRPFVVAAAATALLLVFTHRENVRRLLAGTERRLGSGEEIEE